MRGSAAAILAGLGTSAFAAGPGCGGTTTVGAGACPDRPVRECTCSNGESGVSRCDPDSGGWGECECDGADGSGGSASASGGAAGAPGGAASASGGASTGNDVPDCSDSDWASFGCESAPVELERANVLLVLDRSGSMGEQPAGYTTSKWDALQAELRQLLPEVQGVLSVGLELFPTPASADDPIPSACAPVDRCCEMPGDTEPNVPIGVGTTTVAHILGALDAVGPVGGTPTDVALGRAYEYFRTGAGASLGGDRYVLLVTDGAPNCNAELSCDADTCIQNLEGLDGCTVDGINCCRNDPLACLDDAATLEQIVALRGIGVRTAVVGLPGTERYASRFEQFAAAGDFQRADGTTAYYAASEDGGVAQLTEILSDIIRQLTGSCTVLVPYEIPNPNAVQLAVDCEIVPATGGLTTYINGWWFLEPYGAGPLYATIAGPVCDRILTGGVERIDLILSCGPIELD